ncbi:CD047 protein, partial [Acromyrmex insinuator]
MWLGQVNTPTENVHYFIKPRPSSTDPSTANLPTIATLSQYKQFGSLTMAMIKLSTCISRIFTDKVFLGFFTDPPPGPFDVYQKPIQFRDVAKGRQILSGPRIHLFTKECERIFEGEAHTELWRNEARQRIEDEKRKIGGHMKPTSPSKKHSTPGDWYGCFAKSSYFSPMWKEKEKKKTPLPNMKIKPNPLGGPGYANICLNPYPSYSHEPYDLRMVDKKVVSKGRFLRTSAPLDYFPPNPYKDEELGPTYIPPIKIARKTLARFYVPFPKKPGGSHDGCFSKFPEYTGDPYVKAKEAVVPKRKFISSGPFLRSKYTNSIIEQITKISCNARNYSEYRERVYPMH